MRFKKAAIISDIKYLFGQCNFIYIMDKARKSLEILRSYAWGNHVTTFSGYFTGLCWIISTPP